jgi:hypothetical protein
VPPPGIEPGRACAHCIPSAARLPISSTGAKLRPRPDSNGHLGLSKNLLYPVELRGRKTNGGTPKGSRRSFWAPHDLQTTIPDRLTN